MNNLNIDINIKKPSLNSFTFFLPLILDLSKDGKSMILKELNFALTGNSIQKVKSLLTNSKSLNALVYPIT